MDHVDTIAAMRRQLDRARAEGRPIALVPTMGFLHAGHMRLVDAARESGARVVLSIFVNPLQFGAGEDLDRYPRDLERDTALATAHGVDLVFTPSVPEMYPASPTVRVNAGALGTIWEGAVRPGHFDGVLTVVAKLFHIVAPDRAYFGQKDVQQLALVRHMVRDLNFAVAITGVPTMRDPDGLALSSRNVYLTSAQRTSALALSVGLDAAHRAWQDGVRDPGALRTMIERELQRPGDIVAEYIAIVDADTLEPVTHVGPGTVIAVAARVGKTRLIDNIILPNADL
jgi:pantoate--beta-alanine ligase